MLTDNSIDEVSASHLDRCLTCRSCETTCPSGVSYGRLLDIGRELKAEHTTGDRKTRVLTSLLLWLVPKPALFGALLHLGQWLRPILPRVLQQLIFPRPKTVAPAPSTTPSEPAADKDNAVLLLRGCAQKAATPGVTEALAHLLAHHGRSVRYLDKESCCGALDHHVAATDSAVDKMEALIAEIEHSGAETIVSSASGCGVTIKDYPKLLGSRPSAGRAEVVASKTIDATELLQDLPLSCRNVRVAVQTPCSLQHGQGINGVIERILAQAGATIVGVRDAHLCCGSAGTYSIVQPEMSAALRVNKLAALGENNPEVIVTANIGCQMHLGATAEVPVMHWLEFLYHYGQ